jgi:hypothetical protein
MSSDILAAFQGPHRGRAFCPSHSKEQRPQGLATGVAPLVRDL